VSESTNTTTWDDMKKIKSESLDTSSTVYDCVIVGGGIVGLFLATCSELEGLKIAVISGGPRNENDVNLDSSKSSVANDNLPESFHISRPRALGGASRIWGGRLREFDQWDIEERLHLGLKPWPIDWGLLKGLYQKVFDELNLIDVKTSFESPRNLKNSNYLDFNGREFWLNDKNFLSITSTKLQKKSKVRVFENFSYLKVLESNIDKPEFLIRCADKDANQIDFKCKTIVFASGAVENVRHLLNMYASRLSADGPQSQSLGKNFMVHLLANFPHIKQPKSISFDFQRIQKLNYKRTVQLSRAFQYQEGLANSLGTFSPVGTNLLNLANLGGSGARVLKRYGRDLPKELFLRRKYLKEIFIKQLHSRNRYLHSQDGHDRNSVFSIWGEQIPNILNTIKLSQEKDEFGINKVEVKLSIEENDIHSLALSATYFELLFENLAVSKAGEYYERNRSIVEESISSGPLWGHQMGGTQMGETKNEGVVDKFGEAFDFSGVFVCGTSVFPTGSHAAPTSTALALSLNTAQRIKQKIGDR